LLYLGRLLHRKRVDLLVHAFRKVCTLADVQLTIVGDGPEREYLQSLAAGIAQINFKPCIPHEQVHDEMQSHDALILPTECDDWGVVVNEALQSGLAVITTENAGASEMIRHSGAGIICKCDSTSLATAMMSLCDSSRLQEMRALAREYSSTISPLAAARYLRAIAAHTLYGAARPQTPWHISLSVEGANESTQHCLHQRGRSVDDANRILAPDAAAHLPSS
jgi:glycosyltransferase involved in cell wall biosynthesis